MGQQGGVFSAVDMKVGLRQAFSQLLQLVSHLAAQRAGHSRVGQRFDLTLVRRQRAQRGFQALVERSFQRLRPNQVVMERRDLGTQARGGVRGVAEQQVGDLLVERLHPTGTGQVQGIQAIDQRRVVLLELRKVAGRSLADVLLQRDHRLAHECAQALRSTGQRLLGRPALTQRDGDMAEAVVGLEPVDGMLAGRGDLAARNLELDLAGAQHRGDDVAQGVGRPTKTRRLEMAGQAGAVHRAVGVDVVADADDGRVVGLEAGAAVDLVNQAQLVELAADGRRVGSLQKALGRVSVNPHRGIAVTVVHLGGHQRQQFARSVQQFGVQR